MFDNILKNTFKNFFYFQFPSHTPFHFSLPFHNFLKQYSKCLCIFFYNKSFCFIIIFFLINIIFNNLLLLKVFLYLYNIS